MYEFEYEAESRPTADGRRKQPPVVARVSRAELERRGRRRSLYRATGVFVVLLLLQQPLRYVATGAWESAGGIDAEVPARLSLIVDVAMVGAYWMVGYRALELVWAWWPGRHVKLVAYLAAALLAVGGIADLVENVLLWMQVEGESSTADLSLPWSRVMFWAVAVGLAALVLIAQIGAGRLPQLRETPPVCVEPPRAKTAICCSGGGMRSASFCLGGLQELTERRIYQGADVVIGVSGGGYMAAGYHSVRWHSESPDGTWPDLDPPAFSPSSPELHWLRRNSRYLLDSAQSALQGLQSLLFGIAVNLVLVTAVLGTAAWFLGWYVLASGALSGWDTADATSLAFASDWTWVTKVAALPLLGVGLFVLVKVADKLIESSYVVMIWVRPVQTLLITGGAVLVALLLGVPVLLAAIHDYAAGSDSPWAQLLHALGFVPDGVCMDRLDDQLDACGVNGEAVDAGDAEDAVPATANSAALLAGGLGAVLAAVLAVVKAAGGLLESDDDAKPARSGLARFAAKVWPFLKRTVLPWLAAVLIVVVLAMLLLRWIAALVADPDGLASWDLAAAVGGAVLGIRLLTDANRTSLHHFYRERLSYAFMVRRAAGRVGPLPYGDAVRFSQSGPREGAGPRLVSCAVANVNDPGIVPVGRGCAPFAFDDRVIGLTDQRLPSGAAMTPSAVYEYAADRRFRDATIPAAIAMSGAAFSPLAGRENARVSPFRMVLALANARLGVWLPNPLWVDEIAVARRLVKSRNVDETRSALTVLSDEQRSELEDRYLNDSDKAWLAGLDGSGSSSGAEGREGWRVRGYKIVNAVVGAQSKPGPFRLLKEAVGRTSLLDRRLYVTDGGHYDNLGLVEALRRRADVIYVLDASADPEDTFRALGRAIATARMDLDCEVDFDPRSMRRLKAERSAAAWGVGRYRYPDGTEGEIRMVKVVMVDGLPWDVESYSGQNARFPLTSTGDQLYGEFDLEAYRVLGREVTRKLLAHCSWSGSLHSADASHPERAGDGDHGGEQVEGGVAAAEGE